jgi:hypothetical protein
MSALACAEKFRSACGGIRVDCIEINEIIEIWIPSQNTS